MPKYLHRRRGTSVAGNRAFTTTRPSVRWSGRTTVPLGADTRCNGIQGLGPEVVSARTRPFRPRANVGTTATRHMASGPRANTSSSSPVRDLPRGPRTERKRVREHCRLGARPYGPAPSLPSGGAAGPRAVGTRALRLTTLAAVRTANLPGGAFGVSRATAAQPGASYTSDALGVSFRYPDA